MLTIKCQSLCLLKIWFCVNLNISLNFFLVLQKTPFAKPPSEKFELTQFFREWQQAPPLETFKELHPVEATDLQKQLETFESDLNEFDSIMQTLCQNSPNNNWTPNVWQREREKELFIITLLLYRGMMIAFPMPKFRLPRI